MPEWIRTTDDAVTAASGLLGFLANFGGCLAGRRLLLLGQDFRADGLEALLVEVLPELAVGHREKSNSSASTIRP